MLVPLLALALLGAGAGSGGEQPPRRCSCISQVVRDRRPDSEWRRLLLDYADAWFVGTVVRAFRVRDSLRAAGGGCRTAPDPQPVESPHVQALMRVLGEPNFRRQR